ncbi:site-2 protease family protein [Thalassobacillus pellis]|uniref:site-2 protease family protein n=1 Tax=Thalassobacillus pellis TaxID=748008 RepID=UPI00196052B8|nr:site-2 protease family protein [Thalassobacillus pellis]MBM7554623.1 stage IV sporulation protein FB [Thalassobacillus pellis]
MKNLDFFTQLHLHPILILFIFTSLITGAFVELLILFGMVTIHEWGHYRMARKFEWRIQGVTLWLFGGTIKCEEHGSRPLREQLAVTLAGPFQHVWVLLLLIPIEQMLAGTQPLIDIAIYYNWLLLGFNLIPIWPLDGGKLLFYGCCRFLPYRTAHHAVILFSICFLVMLIILLTYFSLFTLHGCLLGAFLLLENRIEWKRRYYSFIRYLMHRHRAGLSTGKIIRRVVEPHMTIWDLLTTFRSDRQHAFFIKGLGEKAIVSDADCLYYYFNKGNPHIPVKELVTIKK